MLQAVTWTLNALIPCYLEMYWVNRNFKKDILNDYSSFTIQYYPIFGPLIF